MEHLKEIGPEFLLAWAGWLVHSFVHYAGHWVARGAMLASHFVKHTLRSVWVRMV